MLKKNVNEFQQAIRKFIARLLILSAIVVCGAIAIAQAPHEDSDANLGTPETFSGSDVATALPKPQTDSQLKPVSHETVEPQEQDDAFRTFLPVASLPHETDAEDHSLAAEQELIADDNVELAQLTDDEALIDLPGEDTLSADDSDLSGDSYGYSNEVQLPAAAPHSGGNPYRTGADVVDEPAADGYDLTAEANYSDSPAADTVDDATLEPVGDYVADGGDYDDSAYEDAAPAPYESDLPVADDSYVDQQPLETEPSSFQYQDQPEHSGTHGLRRDTLSADSSSYQSDQQPNANTQFERTERIEQNPLPQRYAIARRHNLQATGRPGPQTLEGPQTPSFTIEKTAPTEVQVGKPARFQIKVRNVGQVPGDNVIVRDEVPENTTYTSSTPEAQLDPSGGLVWELGTLNPGEESTITTEFMPTEEGQVGSVATVSFEASASASARSTKPALTLEHTSPRKVLVGEPVRFAIKISNPGSGSATKVVLDEDVPTGLSHSSGPKLEYEVGTIMPGQTRHLELTLTASQPGTVTNVLVARGDAGLEVKDTVELEVVAPELQVGIDGPSKRYLEREATFTVSVANPGSAAARNVELVAQLPEGLKFLSTNNSGHYDQTRHAIIWNLEQLPAGEMGKAQFKALPTAMGNASIQVNARADRNLTADESHQMGVEGIAALYFGVADKVDPIDVGGETTYVITVENQGSKTANNIRFVAEVPEGMQPVNGQGATQGMVRGQQVVFDPIVKLPPKAKTSFEVVVRGVRPGDQKLRVKMDSDELQTPVFKEESTHVYTD
ncbi:MAG: DUF11 domain-containing protein [Planctomycetales bacterium]|nr:DUF11 domain-containing protein [Planctomycetales bacterium]